jgi:formate dehydrogenase major subunit
VARDFAGARAGMIFWGMGVSQHIHGTDNARCLISLALMCGHVGRPGTGLHPLRGQNNVQGASDAGLIPMFLPDYQTVTDEGVRKAFTEVWESGDFSAQKGLTVTEIMDAVNAGARSGACISWVRTRPCRTPMWNTRAVRWRSSITLWCRISS